MCLMHSGRLRRCFQWQLAALEPSSSPLMLHINQANSKYSQMQLRPDLGVHALCMYIFNSYLSVWGRPVTWVVLPAGMLTHMSCVTAVTRQACALRRDWPRRQGWRWASGAALWWTLIWPPATHTSMPWVSTLAALVFLVLFTLDPVGVLGP
jgi:hypothetical protein